MIIWLHDKNLGSNPRLFHKMKKKKKKKTHLLVGIMWTSAPQMGGRLRLFRRRLSWQPHPQRLCHHAEAIQGTRCELYWVIRSRQSHNAQKSVINWVVATSGRKSNLKRRSYFHVIWWSGVGLGWRGAGVFKYTLRTNRLDRSCFF